jgi:cell division transport system permease protein
VKVSYVARETGANLKRNITLTVASILTVAVSLTLAGVGWNLYRGVDRATAQWGQGVQFAVFMNPDATGEQVDNVRKGLESNPQVKSARFVDHDEAFTEFKKLYKGTTLGDSLTSPAEVPQSFRVVPTVKDADQIQNLSALYKGSPGVRSVTLATEVIRRFQRFTGFFVLVFVIVAVASLLSAGLLIVNTIRLAIFSRRREIEVMKLVGATNWFIRIPFMLEGLVQGLVGALVAWGGSWMVNRALHDSLSKGVRPDTTDTLQMLTASSGEIRLTGLALVVLGTVIGAAASGAAVTRFLDV